MTHPFWIVNSSLLVLVCAGLIIINFVHIPVPKRQEIMPLLSATGTRELRTITVNIKKIYENDLFNSYQKPIVVKKEAVHIPFPEPPKPETITLSKEVQPKFLEKLNIVLKGSIVVHSDLSKNRAIILITKTEQEATYKVGDRIDDAQLIRIFHNRVVFLRSNGQQEVIYLRPQDALNDNVYLSVQGWGNIIKEQKKHWYVVHPVEFTQRVKNISQLIQMLNLSTVYQKGSAIGIRIGQLEPQSLGTHLGLQTGDIVISINGVMPNTTKNRVDLYNSIVKEAYPQDITLLIVRQKREVTVRYTIEEFFLPDNALETQIDATVLPATPAPLQPSSTEVGGSFDTTLKRIQTRERQFMLARA
jgi:type II secretion system protein C